MGKGAHGGTEDTEGGVGLKSRNRGRPAEEAVVHERKM